MRRLIASAAGSALLAAAPAVAQDGGGWMPALDAPYIAGNLGGDLVSDNTDDRVTLKAGPGLDANLRAGLRPYSWLRAELGLSYVWLPVDQVSGAGPGLGGTSADADGTLTGTALTTGVYYDAARTQRFTPIAGIRFGVGRAGAQAAGSVSGISLDLDTSGYAFAWGFTGGASFAVTERLRTELLYQSLHTWQREFQSYELALHAHSVTLGLRYRLFGGS